MSKREYVLDIANIIRILPQRPPAVLLDQVVELNPGSRVLATKNITISDPAFLGHFPGFPVYPGTRMLDVMVQACTVLAYATEKFDPSNDAVSLVGVNKTKFRRAVLPGEVLDVEAELTQRRSNVWRFDVTAYVDDFLVAESGIVLSIMRREDLF
mgnify:CR=1 FL=1